MSDAAAEAGSPTAVSPLRLSLRGAAAECRPGDLLSVLFFPAAVCVNIGFETGEKKSEYGGIVNVADKRNEVGNDIDQCEQVDQGEDHGGDEFPGHPLVAPRLVVPKQSP